MSYPNPLQPSFTASLAVFYIFVLTFAEAQSKRKIYKSQGNYLILVVCGDNLPDTVYMTIFPGTEAFSDNGKGTIDNQDLWHFKNLGNLALWVFDKASNQHLLTEGEEPLATVKDADQYPGDNILLIQT